MKEAAAVIILASIFSGCGGCSSSKPTVPETIPTGNAIARAGAHVDSADSSVKAAKPHADKTGKALLTEASKSHQNAKGELEKAEASNAKATAQIAALSRENDAQKGELAAYRDQWIGDAAKRWAKIVAGVYLFLGVGGMLLKTFAGGWLGGVGGFLMKFLPMANPFVWVGKWLERKKAPAVATDPFAPTAGEGV